jgi:hypothetical protein
MARSAVDERSAVFACLVLLIGDWYHRPTKVHMDAIAPSALGLTPRGDQDDVPLNHFA